MPRRSRKVYLARRIGVLAALSGLLATGFYLPFTLLAPVGPAELVTMNREVPAGDAPQAPFPGYGASAFGAVGYDGVLESAGATEALPIASITKVVTALVVLETHPLQPGEPGPALIFDDVDVQYFEDQFAIDGTRQPVSAGLSLSEFDVLQLMLMASANNYALSLARWAFGTQEAFIAATTSWLTANGLTSIVIREPTGLDAANVASAADLVELGKLALEHPVVAQIVATPVAEIVGIGVIENRNALLGVGGVDGIKTGTLDETGANLLFSADRQVGSETVTLVGVVLGGPDQATIRGAVQAILDTAATGFVVRTLAPAGEEWGRFSTPWGDQASAVTASALEAVVWAGADVGYDAELDPVSLAPAGTDVGDLTFTVGQRSYTVDLLLDATIDDPGPGWRLTHPFELG